jgi:hypothetical protein
MMNLPLVSITKFSGFISRWIIPFMWMYSKALMMQATKNPKALWGSLRVCSSVNFLWFQIWYLKSPPESKSITRYKFSRSWKAYTMLTINLRMKKSAYGYLRLDNIIRSFMTDLTERLEITLAFDISFIANNSFVFFFSTFQTFPNPPFPIA